MLSLDFQAGIFGARPLYPLAMVAAESGARRSDYGGSSRRWVRAAGAGGISCRVASAIGGTIVPR